MQVDNIKHDAPRARSVPNFARHLGVGKSTVWQLIKDGRLRAVRINGRTLVLAEDGERFLRNLPSAVAP